MSALFFILISISSFAQTEIPLKLTNEGVIEEEKNEEINTKHQVLRRLALFPVQSDDLYKKEADAAWWSMREFLAETQRFLVASKRFMSQKDAYQPRKIIAPTDVILLSKLLDADSIISTFISNGKLRMIAYSGNDGFPLWENSIEINPSLPVSKQIEVLCLKLIKDFLASIPYQAFQIIDPLIGKSIYEEGNTYIAKIDVGGKSGTQVGESVQWIEIERQSPAPLFTGGGSAKVIAEGEIVRIENQTALVEIKRVNDIKLLDKKSIVSIPNEYSRLQSQFSLVQKSNPKISTIILNSPMYPAETQSEKSKPLVTAISSVASLVTLLLLAL